MSGRVVRTGGGGGGGDANPEGVHTGGRSWSERQGCKRLTQPSQEKVYTAPEGPQKQGGDVQTRLEDVQLLEACHAGWGQNMGRAGADQTDAGGCKVDGGGMCKPRPGTLQSWE